MIKHLKNINGVYFLTEKKNEFSEVYLEVRKKEGRIHSDQVVARLPQIEKSHPNYKEWKMREKSTERICRYLSTEKQDLSILDLGCGNGWFTNLLAEIPGTEVIGVDVNDLELEQAARVFKKSNLLFVYADIFSPEADALKEFDIITLNSCIQYFDDFKKITDLLQLKLKKGGELHIIDSPFYHQDDIAAARNRTNEYFDQLGYPEMAKNYFHHSWTDVSDFHSLYDPKKSKIKKLFGVADTPFHWLCRKQEVW